MPEHSTTLRRGFLTAAAARPPDPAPPPPTAPTKRKDPPPPGPSGDGRPPSRAAKTAAADRIRQQTNPRAPLSNALHAVRTEQLEIRRAADQKVAKFIDKLIADLADLESGGAMNTHACRLLVAAAEAVFKQALAPNAIAPPEQLLKALHTWNPADPRSVDDIRLDARPTYATAARKGKGKAIKKPPPAPSVPRPPPAPLRPLQGFRLRGQLKGSAEAAVAAADSRSDNRLFVRLSSKHELRTKHAYFIKKSLLEALATADAPAHIGLDTIKHVPSGLALRPSDSCSATELFAFHELIKVTLKADRVDISNQWDRFVLMNVPCAIDGENVPDEILAEELEAALDCPLTEPPRRLGRTEELVNQRTSSVLFSIPSGRMPVGLNRLTVLGQRFSFRVYKEQKASENCDKCLSQHHTTAVCKELQPRCKTCGDEGHEAQSEDCRVVKAAPDSIDKVPFCYHCHGPHPAFSPGCYAAARYSKEVRSVTIPTGTRLARARNAGTRRRQRELARIRIATSLRTSRTVEEQEEADGDGLLGLDGGVGVERISGAAARTMPTASAAELAVATTAAVIASARAAAAMDAADSDSDDEGGMEIG